MKAYIESLSIVDDDEKEIAIIKHREDFHYDVELKKDAFISPDDFRFIADVLEIKLLEEEIEIKKDKE